MPTPLPAIEVPDYAPVLNAQRLGMQDKLAADKRRLMQEAGGLAAAGNYKGAMGALYKGGEFEEARGVSGEMRANSAEARAAAQHARAMSNDALERASKGQELMGRIADLVKTPQDLDRAKAMLKARGLNVDSVTMEQLPFLRQQGITQQQALENERANRQFDAENMRANRALDFQQSQAGLQQFNADRTLNENRRQFDLTRSDQQAQRGVEAGKLKQAQNNWQAEFGLKEQALNVAKARANALAKKAMEPKPLTEGQAKAQGYVKELEDVEKQMIPQVNAPSTYGGLVSGKVLKEGSLTSNGSSPLSSRDQSIAMNEYVPHEIQNMSLNKQQKQFLQNAEQFISVLLYHRSGAQISAEEFKRNFRIYFPQPGDDQRTLRMKKDARMRVISGLRVQGNAVPENQSAAPSSDLGGLSNDDFLAGFNSYKIGE